MENQKNELETGISNEMQDDGENRKEGKKPVEKERRTLSPEEIQKRKKMLIYPLMVLVFIGALYWIFAPSKAEKEKQETGQGLNLEIPQDRKSVV